MCVQCAVQTPVGYRCRACIRGLEDKFFTAKESDYLLVFAVCAVLGAAAGWIMLQFQSLFVALLAGFPIGGLISEAARRVLRGRRGRYTAQAAASGTALGALAPILLILIQFTQQTGIFNIRLIGGAGLTPLLFAGLAAAAVYARFNMFK
jgi:predicted PurR-regulated permease PerM